LIPRDDADLSLWLDVAKRLEIAGPTLIEHACPPVRPAATVSRAYPGVSRGDERRSSRGRTEIGSIEERSLRMIDESSQYQTSRSLKRDH
jgi:hypothetical protein